MKFKIFHILLFISSVMVVCGQVNIDVITDKKEYYSKDLVQLTVILEINGEDLVQESPIRLPDFSHFYERGTGSTKNTLMNPESNTVASQLVYQMLLQPKQSGKIKIGSALVKVNGKIYKTEPFDIIVLEKPEKIIAKSTSNDLHFTMEIENTEVYLNQPVIAVIKAHSSNFNSLRKIKNIQLPPLKGVRVYPLELRPSEIEMNRKKGATQTLAVYMLFPEKTGKVEISPATVSIGGHQLLEKFTSNTTYLNVKKLPTKSPANFDNAVGDFQLEIKNLDEGVPVEVNKPLDILITLKGKGNIGEDILPKIIKSEDYDIFPPKIKEKIKKKKTGLEGEIEAHYILIPKKQGDVEVLTTGFSFFDPEKEKYTDLGEKSLKLRVQEPLENQKTTLQKVNEYTSNVIDNVNIPILDSNNKTKNGVHIFALLSDYFLWGLAIIGTLVGAFAFLRKKNNAKEEPKEQDALSENIADIEAKIRIQQSEEMPTIAELRTLLSEHHYKDYLQSLEGILMIWEKQSKRKSYANFAQELENNQGKQASEEYQNLVQQVKTEKYAPWHTPEQMQNIHQKLETIFQYRS